MVNYDMKLLSQKLKSYLKAICKLACGIFDNGCCTDSFSQNTNFFVIICTPKVKFTLREVLMMLENQ